MDDCREAGANPMSAETEAVEAFYAAVNRDDMAAMVSDIDPEVVRIEPEGFPTAGTYRGLAAVREHVAKGRATWAEGSCDPERLLVNGDRIVAELHVRVRLQGSSDWIEGRFADGFRFRDGRIVEYRSFTERAEAREWAGIEEREAR
jgi:ketosteroid isomerase-like protein